MSFSSRASVEKSVETERATKQKYIRLVSYLKQNHRSFREWTRMQHGQQHQFHSNFANKRTFPPVSLEADDEVLLSLDFLLPILSQAEARLSK